MVTQSPPTGDAPTRYDCLCCEDRYLTEDELHTHVSDVHDPDDVVTSLAPINIPPVARFPDDPDITNDREAKVAINRDDREGELPEVSRQVADGICPVCGEGVATDAEVPIRILPRSHGSAHDTWEWYSVLRETVPDDYEVSPTYDNDGRPDPAGTVMELVPGDKLTFRAKGWSQSVSSGKFQRDTITEDDEWCAVGVVTDIDDPRSDPFASDWDYREVDLRANTELADETVTVTLMPKEDGSVRLTMEPLIKQAETAKRWGRSGGGNVRSDVIEAERTPWYERD